MNPEYYNLDEPIEKVVISNMIKFSINNVVVSPFNSATMTVVLVDELNHMIDGMFLTLDGEAYTAWLTDEYLVDWVKLQIQYHYGALKRPV